MVEDLDADGNADIVFAAPDESVLYFFSDAGSLSGKINMSTASATIWGDGIWGGGPSYLGLAMDSGDIDGDGEQDLVVGAPDTVDVASYYYADEPGRVYVFTEDPSSYRYASEADAQFVGDKTADLMGSSLSVGDLSNDGKDDLIFSAPTEWLTYGRVWILEAP